MVMLTVVHVVGEADTGLDTASLHAKEHVDKRRNIQREVVEAISDSDPSTVGSWFPHHVKDLPPAIPMSYRSKNRQPLVILRDIIAARIPVPEQIQLLLLATAGDGPFVTDQYARAVRTAVAKDLTLFGGQADAEVVVVTMDSAVTYDNLLQSLASDPTQADTEVLMLWAGGASQILLAAISAVISSGRPWRVLQTKTGQPVQPPVQGLLPAVVPWLLRYGHADRVQQSLPDWPPGTPIPEEVRHEAESARRIARGECDPDGGLRLDDLRRRVLVDLRRGGRLSGLLIRTWVVREYQVSLSTDRADGITAPDLLQYTNENPGSSDLGGAIHLAVNDHTIPGKAAAFFRDRRVLEAVKAANRSAHEFRPMAPRHVRVVQDLMSERGGCLPDTPSGIGPLAVPSGRIGCLWVVNPYPTPERPAYAVTLASKTIDVGLCRRLGLTDRERVPVDALLVHTPLLADLAASQVTDALAQIGPVKFVNATAAQASQTRDAAQQAAAAWLSRQHMDVLIVPPVGDKDMMLGVLLASWDYGSRNAVPVLVASLDKNAKGLSYIPLLSLWGTDEVLAEVAIENVRRLSFDVAAGLLSVGSPALAKLAGKAFDLDGRFYASNRHPLRPLANPAGDRVSPELRGAKLNLIGHVADEHWDRLSPYERLAVVHTGAEMAMSGRDLSTSPPWTTALWRIRNQLAVNHGTGSLGRAIKTAHHRAKGALGTAVPSILGVLHGARDEAQPADSAESGFVDEFDGLLSRLAAARDKAKKRTSLRRGGPALIDVATDERDGSG